MGKTNKDIDSGKGAFKKHGTRNPYALGAIQRTAATFHDRRQPRGGAKNVQAEFLGEMDDNEPQGFVSPFNEVFGDVSASNEVMDNNDADDDEFLYWDD